MTVGEIRAMEAIVSLSMTMRDILEQLTRIADALYPSKSDDDGKEDK